jgi:hypothetical protein
MEKTKACSPNPFICKTEMGKDDVADDTVNSEG